MTRLREELSDVQQTKESITSHLARAEQEREAERKRASEAERRVVELECE